MEGALIIKKRETLKAPSFESRVHSLEATIVRCLSFVQNHDFHSLCYRSIALARLSNDDSKHSRLMTRAFVLMKGERERGVYETVNYHSTHSRASISIIFWSSPSPREVNHTGAHTRKMINWWAEQKESEIFFLLFSWILSKHIILPPCQPAIYNFPQLLLVSTN